MSSGSEVSAGSEDEDDDDDEEEEGKTGTQGVILEDGGRPSLHGIVPSVSRDRNIHERSFPVMFIPASIPRCTHSFCSSLVAFAVVLLATPAHGQLTVNGAGATLPFPIYSKWFDSYAKVDDSVRFNYQSIGSGGGQKQIMERTVDFGASDGPMTDENLAKAPGKLLHIPTVAGAVVITYNVPGLKKLNLDGDVLAGIYLGKIISME